MAKAFSFRGNDSVGAMVEDRLVKAGYDRVTDAGAASVSLTYFTSQQDLEDAYFDDGGLVQEAKAGSILIDLSPTTPTFARELNAVATVNDLAVVEAPLIVSNPVIPDAFGPKGNVSCFAAGDEEHMKLAAPVLEDLFGEVRVIGAPGAAQLARAAYTLQASAQIVSVIEADALYRAVRRSQPVPQESEFRTGAATTLAEEVLAAVGSSAFDGSSTVEMLMAELTAALGAADDADLILPQAEACMHLLELLSVIGGSDKNPAALSLAYREEEECAAAGLDWSRAEEAYGHLGGRDDDDDDYGFGAEGGDPDDPCDGYPGYSAN